MAFYMRGQFCCNALKAHENPFSFMLLQSYSLYMHNYVYMHVCVCVYIFDFDSKMAMYANKLSVVQAHARLCMCTYILQI